MLLKLYQTGQPVLRRPAARVSRAALAKKRTQDIIDFMIATLRDAPGVGLAAPQVGESLKIIIIEDKAEYHEQVPAAVLQDQIRKPVKLRVLVNPEIEIIDSTPVLYFEGCLSVEGYAAAVSRASSLKVTAMDRHGKPLSYIARGWQARILQHEIDHLNGILLIDKMSNKSFMSLKNFNMLWRKALSDEISREFGAS